MGFFTTPESSQDSTRQTTPESPGELLVTSPYTTPEHLLNLSTLDNENALFAKALTSLRATRDDYATASYLESFNWTEVMDKLRQSAELEQVDSQDANFAETSFFIVAFRSRIPPTTVYEDLGILDEGAHAEAVACGGFLKYWFGHPDSDGRNLATCVWRSRDDAIRAGHTPGHKRAARATASMYSHWKIDRHRLVVGPGAKEWKLIDWSDDYVPGQ